MRTDSVKKYVIPNIPYLFILWACLKLGTAYRLAPGADFAHKLMGLGQSIGPAFADFAPGLAPFDWLIGIVGAVGFRLLIYFKSKNAKKFRRDEEYGSARWGTEKDIKPFVDPKFENNVILTKTEFLTMNTRPKNPANARNLNACIIGSSGSGKTRFWLTPQLLQAHSSYVCVDPKGGVLSQVGAFLQRRGYQVKVFNSIDFSKSMHYNPLSYIHNEADILKFVDTLIANTKGEGKEGDPFWTKAETLLYCALIAYIIFEAPAEDRNINTLVDMISGMDVKEDDESYMNAVDYMFKGLEKGPAYERWAKVYNIKQMAAALLYLREHDLMDYAALASSTEAAVDRAHKLAVELRDTEAALAKTSELMGAVVQYAKTRPVFDGYKAARYSRKYLAQHEAELADYRAAKAAMSELLGGAKLPKMDTLKKQHRELSEKKKALYAEYRKAQADMRQAVAVKANIDHLLGHADEQKNKAQER